MIYVIVGGVGSGKSLSAVKMIKNRGCRCFTNFDMKGIKGYRRLKHSDIVMQKVESFKKDGSPKKVSLDVNFGFWEKEMKKGGFDVYIDELQGIANSRRSQSNENVVWNKFISQIRKMLGSTEKNNIYLITQRPNSIDVQFRELAHVWILCNKILIHSVEVKTNTPEGIKNLPLCVITMSWFRSLEELELYSKYESSNLPFHQSWFMGNGFYKYYDSYSLIDFSGEYI